MTNFFCHLPFVSIETNGYSATPCCVWSGPAIPIQAYQHDIALLDAKKKLWQGRAPKECNRCVSEEANSGTSFRTLANDFHPHLTQEVLAKEPSYSNIRYVSVIGSNICNLQCLPCEFGSYKRSKELHDIGYSKSIPVLRKLSDVENIANFKNIEQLTLCSGEPFYDKDSWRLIDVLVTNKRSKQIRLDINTNLTSITQEKIDYLVDNFNHVLIKGSVDGIHAAHEYLRYPASWQEIDQSVGLLLATPGIDLVITTALSNLSLLGYHELIKWFTNQGVRDFFISGVTQPRALHNGNLPWQLKQETANKLKDLIKPDLMTNRTCYSIEMCINICQNEHAWDAKLFSDFMHRHDDIRATNWRNTWPALAEFC